MPGVGADMPGNCILSFLCQGVEESQSRVSKEWGQGTGRIYQERESKGKLRPHGKNSPALLTILTVQSLPSNPRLHLDPYYPGYRYK